MIQTRLCLALTLRDDGLLIEDSNGELDLYIDNSASGEVCEVAEIFVAQQRFGTVALTGIQRVDSNVYSARAGTSELFIETLLCLALPVFDSGVLIWEPLESRLIIDTFSGDVCNVLNVYSN